MNMYSSHIVCSKYFYLVIFLKLSINIIHEFALARFNCTPCYRRLLCVVVVVVVVVCFFIPIACTNKHIPKAYLRFIAYVIASF